MKTAKGLKRCRELTTLPEPPNREGEYDATEHWSITHVFCFVSHSLFYVLICFLAIVKVVNAAVLQLFSTLGGFLFVVVIFFEEFLFRKALECVCLFVEVALLLDLNMCCCFFSIIY